MKNTSRLSPCIWSTAFAGLLLLGLPNAVLAQEPADSFDRRTYYSQPMGFSIWKPQAKSVEEFLGLMAAGKLNATPAQYSQALHDAGWISQPDASAAARYIRGLQQQTVEETKTYRMGRVLRSYRTREGILDSTYYAIIKAGENGYFDAQGNLVIRVLCLNVIYPQRRVSVLPAQEERAEVPQAEPPQPPPPEPSSLEPHFDQPRQFEPPAREAREPLSPSAP